MLKRWIVYMIFLLSLPLLAIALGESVILIFFALLTGVTLLCIMLHRFHPCELSFTVESPETAQKGDSPCALLIAQNGSRIPCIQVCAELLSANLLTGEQTEIPLRFALTPNGSIEIPLMLQSAHCGHMAFSIKHCRIYDPLGLSFRSKDFAAAGGITVLPQTFPVALRMTQRASPAAHGTEYAQEKAGCDPSEPFGIREYIAGDSPKNIHWKLTSKLGRLIIRESGLQAEQSILLLFDTSCRSEKPTPTGCDAAATAFVSLSQSLLAAGLPHTVAWRDAHTQESCCFLLRSEAELMGILRGILSAGTMPDAVPELDTAAFSQIAAVSLSQQTDIPNAALFSAQDTEFVL